MKNYVKITFIVTFGLFICSIILSQIFNSKKQLEIKDSLNLKVEKVKHYKGFVIINDTIAISGNLPEINKTNLKFKGVFSHVNAPFRIIKKSNSDTIIVKKEYGTLYYRLIDDNGW